MVLAWPPPDQKCLPVCLAAPGVNVFLFGEDDEKISEIITYRQPTEEEKTHYLGIKDFSSI